MREESRVLGQDEWAAQSTLEKLQSIASQFVALRRGDAFNQLAQDKTSFALKTRRVEYTFEYFRSLLEVQEQRGAKLSVKEIADQNFVNEMRFVTAHMLGITYLVGLNAAALGYFLAFRKLKLYVGIPLTFATYILARNFSMKHCMDQIYYPLLPLYQEVRRHHTVSKQSPSGLSEIDAEAREGQARAPDHRRTDLTRADKKKLAL